MWRTMLEKRGVLVLAWAAGVGIYGIRTYPVPVDNVLLEMMALRTPHVFQVLVHGYAALWFTTPLIVGALATSIMAIVVFRHGVTPRQQPLPPYPPPETRPTPSLVLGETHFASAHGRAPAPTWLTVPQRGLYCGVMIVGATGTGKTSACMYPYIDQLLRWRADDPERKIGGLVMDVKGDFGQQVRTMLARADRGSDYLEVGIGTPFCYNPLHNDLDPYAVAYAIASLLNNLYGRSKEPFWQQAYTDVMRSAIAMRRLTDPDRPHPTSRTPRHLRDRPLPQRLLSLGGQAFNFRTIRSTTGRALPRTQGLLVMTNAGHPPPPFWPCPRVAKHDLFGSRTRRAGLRGSRAQRADPRTVRDLHWIAAAGWLFRSRVARP